MFIASAVEAKVVSLPALMFHISELDSFHLHRLILVDWYKKFVKVSDKWVQA